MLATCFKKRDHHRRTIILLVIIALSTCIFSLEGESAVSFLYMRNKFGWDIRKHTEFTGAATLVSVFGTVTGMCVVSVWLRIPDSIFALCVFITKFAQTIISGLAPYDWYLYIACAVGFLGGVSGPLCRSLISKTVPLEDIGAVFALTSVVEAVTPIAASSIYTFVYNATLLIFPGTFYIVSSAVFAVDVILLSCVTLLQRTLPTNNYIQVAETVNEQDVQEQVPA
jgi:PCFT/HCP family folate transporter-like MFS transporter 1/3